MHSISRDASGLVDVMEPHWSHKMVGTLSQLMWMDALGKGKCNSKAILFAMVPASLSVEFVRHPVGMSDVTITS